MGRAGRVLLVLVVLGIALRILAAIGSWPTMQTLQDGYQLYAKSNPFADPQHPAGYALIIATVGAVTRQVAALIVLQHVFGIVSALLMMAATRRITGSAWAGLLPAAMILLGADHIFLEHVVMSESWEVLACSVGLYTAVRALDERVPWWRWPLLTGVILGMAVVIRSAALPLVAVAVLAMIVYRGPGSEHRLLWWRAPLASAGAAILVLLAFGAANARFGQGFEIAPSPGWYLYGQAAQFADCKQFRPPPGTAVLCETRPESQRPGYYKYLFDPHAPAPHHFGTIGSNDGVVGGWARRALLAQFGDYLGAAWVYLRAYWVPGSLPARLRSGNGGLDPQVDFTFGNPVFAPAVKISLESYFSPFAVHTQHGTLQLLHDWQRVVRFGATALFITTVLTLVGLIIGTRRSRAAVILFGLGGLSLIVAPVLVGNYTGRFTVPMAGPLMAGAAVTILEAWRQYGTAASERSQTRPMHRSRTAS
ncbi:MAG: phospholipid carrier-dependent glycosyltransferase [Acetobacteraceae bacterium]|nr:phospholipid carrier-dependent glycosyltransferase [Acetobacteraceae bacterium]